MSYQVTIVGDDFADVVAQMASLVGTFGGKAEKPARAPRGVKAAAADQSSKKTAAQIAAEMPGESIVEPDAEDGDPTEPEPAPAPEKAEDPAKTKDKALAMLRDVYASGKEGQAKVNAVAKHFGVKKLADIPVEKADELFTKAVEASK